MTVKFTDGCINNEDNFGNFIYVNICGGGWWWWWKISLKETKRYNNGKGNNMVRIYNLCGYRSKLDSSFYHCIILLNSKTINKCILKCDSVHSGMYSWSLQVYGASCVHY